MAAKLKVILHCIKENWHLSLIISVAFMLYMLVIIPSGSYYCFDKLCGVWLWGAHEHDALWHLAVVSTSFNQWPFSFPTFAGAQLSGYNFFLDYILFLGSQLGISASFAYFKIQPVVWFVVFTYLVLRLGRRIAVDKLFLVLLLIFVYFASSFGFIITWLHDHTLLGSSGNMAMQGAVGMTNPQFMWSLCCILALILLSLSSRVTVWRILAAGVVVFVALGLKFYAIVPITIILLSWLGLLVWRRKYLWAAALGLVAAGVGSVALVIFYGVLSGSAGGAFKLDVFATVHQIIEDQNLWYMPTMMKERYFLAGVGKFSPKLIRIEMITLSIFLFFNLGIRLVGFAAPFVRQRRQSRWLMSTLLLIVVASTAASALLVQRGEWWNSIQFFYYGIFFSNILAAYVWYRIIKLIKWKVLQVVVIGVILLLFIPANYDIARIFTHSRTVVAEDELRALRTLRGLPPGIVLTDPFVRNNVPYELSNIHDTAYVTAYAHKVTWAADDTQLKLLSLPYEARQKKLDAYSCDLLREVDYLYIGTKSKFLQCKTELRQYEKVETESKTKVILRKVK